MSNSEQKLVTAAQQEVSNITVDVAEMKSDIKEMYTALLGSKLTQDGGMVERLKSQERRVLIVEEELRLIKEKAVTAALHVKIMWTMGGAIAAAILISVLRAAFN